MSYIKTVEKGEIYELLVAPEVYEGIRATSCEVEHLGLNSISLTASQKFLCSKICRTVFLVTYYPECLVRYLLDSVPEYIEHYAYSVHNADLNKDGSPKKTHIHILIKLVNNQSVARLCSLFHTTEIRSISCISVKHEWDYLLHDSDKCRKEGKYRYSTRITDDLSYWLGRCISDDNSNDIAVSLYDDYIKGLPPREMLKKYGFRYYQNFRVLRELRTETGLNNADSYAFTVKTFEDILDSLADKGLSAIDDMPEHIQKAFRRIFGYNKKI